MSRTQLHPRYQSPEMDDSNDNSGHTWLQENLDSMQLKRSEVNGMIMDYLVHEGFKEAAERFREEAGIDQSNHHFGDETPEMMDKRVEIKHHIEEGDILRAKSLINLHYPELLDSHRDIYFKLQQQHLIELIRQQEIEQVLSYVQDELNVDESRDLTEMERTLALLAYEIPDRSPYANLLKISHRLELASEINDIILQETTGSVEPYKPRLVTLSKLLFWTQTQLEKKKIQFPKMTDLVDGTIVESRTHAVP